MKAPPNSQHIQLIQWTIVLIVSMTHVSYQEDCPVNYFGPGCRFRCNTCRPECCTEECEDNCCKRGYFGYHCQYRDLAAHWGLPQTTFTDSDDSTCQRNESVNTTSIPMQISRLSFFIVTIDKSSKANLIEDITFQPRDGTIVRSCDDGNYSYALNSYSKYFRCITFMNITNVFLMGKGVGRLCTVNIAGGRNMAINQRYNYSSLSLKAEGDRGGLDGEYPLTGTFNNKTCFQARENSIFSNYVVIMNKPALIDYFIVYNRPDAANRVKIIGFQLITYDVSNGVMMCFTEGSRPPDGAPNYTIYNTWPSNALYVFKLAQNYKELQFCEVEAWGDCFPGDYDLDCTKRCSSNCMDTTCQISGYCNGCHTGFWEFDCTKACSSGCAGNLCNKEGGNCTNGCVTGYYGSNCSKVCSSGCAGNLCNREGGDCTNGCQTGFYTSNCTQVCSSGCAGNLCNLEGGDCTNGCQTGFYSPDCSEVCSSGCAGNLCNLEGGDCTNGCQNGYYSLNCTQACPNCLNDGKCAIDTGHCEEGCKKGFEPPTCEDACPVGKYGFDCKENCPVNCVDDCTADEGQCHGRCSNEFFGDNCEKKCPSGKYGLDCSSTCSSHCPLNCTRDEGICLMCEAGYYGQKCEYNCNEGCLDNKCHIENGSCYACGPKYFSSDCSQACSKSCGGSGQCDTIDGQCLSGCINGYHGFYCTEVCSGHCKGKVSCNVQDGKCLDGCEKGFVGTFCEIECPKNCMNGVCDLMNASCTSGCMPGYGDFNCTTNCTNCMEELCEQMSLKCTKGCKKGYIGDDCLSAASTTNNEAEDSSSTSIIIILIALFILITLALAFLLRKKTPAPATIPVE